MYVSHKKIMKLLAEKARYAQKDLRFNVLIENISVLEL